MNNLKNTSYAFSGGKKRDACLGMYFTRVLICSNVCNVGRTILHYAQV